MHKSTSRRAAFTTLVALAFHASAALSASPGQGASLRTRPLPRPGQTFKLLTRTDYKKGEKVCHLVVETSGSARLEDGNPGRHLVVQTLSRRKEGDASCLKVGNAIKRYIYRPGSSDLLKVEECKGEGGSDCSTRDPLPKDNWQEPEKSMECRSVGAEYIETPWGKRLAEKLGCTPLEPVPGGGTSPVDFWTDESLFPIYPHLRIKQSLSIPAKGIEMTTDMRLVEFNAG